MENKIENLILMIRGHKVMLDVDLARLYEVPTKVLNQAVKRNIEKFPHDFMFQLTEEESQTLEPYFNGKVLRSQIVTSKKPIKDLRSQIVTSMGSGGRRYQPYVFTEQGVAMLSSVLRSQRAIQVNIEIMRTFVRLRYILSSHKDLAQKLLELEKKYDVQFKIVFDAIRELMTPPVLPRKKIGFL